MDGPGREAGSAHPLETEAARFMEVAESELLELSIDAQRAGWVFATHITPDTEILAAKADARLSRRTAELAHEARGFRSAGLGGPLGRKFGLLPLSQSLLSPADRRESEELAGLTAKMNGIYAQRRYRLASGGDALDLNALSRLLATRREPALLQEVWIGWHAVGREIRPHFGRTVELANKGARDAGFADTGEMWRSGYDMSPGELAQETRRLWGQLRPLYRTLYEFVRKRLRATYGSEVVPERGPVPAHLFGDMWAQSWDNIFDLVARSDGGGDADLTAALARRSATPVDMVRWGEAFFVSLGFEPLPESFWSRSQFVRPPGREVLCHASAWDIDYEDDLRIKMCIEITGEEFHVIHHELGHNFYQRGYRRQPFLFRSSAHDGFHEAIGDTISLSVTPEYLRRLGLHDGATDDIADRAALLRVALAKVPFFPFGLALDEWRWGVFSGAIPPEEYNTAWWSLRGEYQEVVPPVARSDEEFDPGAKFHIPAGVPYLRYFLAHVLQFQFHRAFARIAGHSGPLHRFTIHGDREVGDRLRRAFEAGQSQPWPETLEILTGERTMDASAVLDYFAPLERWLREWPDGSAV